MTQAKAFESLSEWRDALAALGAKPLHARMLSRALMGRAAALDPEDARFPKRLRTSWESLLARWNAVLRLHSRHPGSDGESERLLGLLADGEAIESVLLPRRGVCVSTQCGCAVVDARQKRPLDLKRVSARFRIGRRSSSSRNTGNSAGATSSSPPWATRGSSRGSPSWI